MDRVSEFVKAKHSWKSTNVRYPQKSRKLSNLHILVILVIGVQRKLSELIQFDRSAPDKVAKYTRGVKNNLSLNG